MARRFVTFVLILLVVISPSSSVGSVVGFKDFKHQRHSLVKVMRYHQDASRINLRTLSGIDIVLDYDDAGANQRHKKPGGGRNP